MARKKPLPILTATFDKIVGGGQCLATLESGQKLFAWGVLPGETAQVQVTKTKSNFLEGVAIEIIKPSAERVAPLDPGSFLSTSPWQIMQPDAETNYKSALIEEAFELHDIVLPEPIETYTDGHDYGYRNKIEFSFWFDTDLQKLSLAFFRRGSGGKIAVDGTSLASPVINQTAQQIVACLNDLAIGGRDLKTVLIRCDRNQAVAWQLYVKNPDFDADLFIQALGHLAERGEIIYSDPRSPASVITQKLSEKAGPILQDQILGVPFNYATEGFFQINLPVYEQALNDMQQFIPASKPVVDMYSGVGSIGLTIGGGDVTLVEINPAAVREMERNIKSLGLAKAKAVLAASENALDFIVTDATIIVDPPRAGLHERVIDRLLEQLPERIVYLSCNPVTQARDVARLAASYGIRHHRGYNFFPRTPHIEHLVVLDRYPN